MLSEPPPTPVRHMLKISDIGKAEIADILRLASAMKKDRDRYNEALKGDTLLMLFEKPSLRTRVSLETGMHQMGGHAIFYSIDNSPLGKKESIDDTGKVLSRMVQGITARVNSRDSVRGLARVSEIPVINALDDFAHPLQMLADILTVQEKFGKYEGLTMAYLGDVANNVTYDLMRLCAIVGMNFKMAGAGTVEEEVWAEIKTLTAATGVSVKQVSSAKEAVADVEVVYCDSWMSYGIPKDEEQARIDQFMPYQCTAELMKLAKPNAVFMNCLPAARGMEQTAEVIDGPQSIVFDQAENRLHAQKALLVLLMRPQSFERYLTKL
ncbi:Ornithine carbamoyltransferase [Diplonema papillatum]|nr:Ornithine carbamoyltransferase [Diplonema papillatum]|eukprot:gene6753-10353_t